jgi:arginyl-tRNA synthetase
MANDIIAHLNTQITTALTALSLPETDGGIEYPKNETHGDYASSVALTLFPKIKESDTNTYSSPLELAQQIVKQLEQHNDASIDTITAVAPGFINFTFSQTTLIDQFNQEFSKNDPITATNQGKKVIVEYSSPNIAKPFTIGHLRSTIIGQAIANIKSATGWTVLRDNHLGDWGTQFGKLIYAIKQNWIPFEHIEGSDTPVKLLVDLYVKFHEEAEKDDSLNDEARAWFKKLEDGDREARQLWQKCIDWSWKEFDRVYQRLGITFSPELNNGRGLGESFFEDKMQVVLDQLESKNLLSVGELGAKVVDFGEKHPPLMILKKDGATLYATRDLATDYYRLQTFQPYVIINEVGNEQSLYFKQIFEIESQLGWYQPHQRVHIGHGMYRFKDGKMSTRKGNVIWLEEVIDKAVQKAMEIIEADPKHNPEEKQQLAHDIGVGALKWNDLKGEAKRDIIFDWDEILSMKGNSGPYIQYTHARTCSLLAKATTTLNTMDSNAPLNTLERSLITWLIRFDATVKQADQTHNPSQIATYLYELCQRFNTFYNQHTILGQNPEQPAPPHRLTLTSQTKKIIHTGLSLLGIKAPEHM